MEVFCHTVLNTVFSRFLQFTDKTDFFNILLKSSVSTPHFVLVTIVLCVCYFGVCCVSVILTYNYRIAVIAVVAAQYI